MVSKNPIKGYVKCPTSGCGCAASVHAVGEHKAASRGEPPKNPRRLGQLYLICPVCKTNQSSGKPFQDWVLANMKPTKAEALNASEEVIATDSQTESKPTQTASVKALEENTPPETQTETEHTDSTNLIGWIAALIVICFGLFMLTNNREKPTHE